MAKVPYHIHRSILAKIKPGPPGGPHTHAPADVVGVAVVDTDPRLQDPRPPKAHGNDNHSVPYLTTSDETGETIRAKLGVTVLSGDNTGDQSLPTDATIVTTDVTSNNASVSKHGWFPKLPAPSGKYLKDDMTWATPAAAPASNPWDGLIVAARGDGNPMRLLHSMQRAGNISPTPTGITITVARISYFRLPANITVNKIRFFGVGATTNVYRVAIYNGDTLARLTAELPFSTAAATWGAAGNGLNLTLNAGQLYFVAVAVNTTGTTAGVLAYGTTVAATTGLIGVLPKNWPGNLNAGLSVIPATAHAQFAVTSGALPVTAPTIVAQTAWTGGFPALFLDNSNA